MTDTPDRHQFGTGLRATVDAAGAELVSLLDGDGTELLWGAGPAWPNHSPVLFPIVGQLAGDRFRLAGQSYPMTRHGFARRRRFEWLERGPDSCRLVLGDDAESRAAFPFGFHLVLAYRVADGTLHTEYTLSNPGSAVLAASLGAHPAFRWPLRDGTQTDYRIEFAAEEPGPVHRLDAGLLGAVPEQTPVQGRVLPLAPALFERDAMIMLEPRSRSLRYAGPGAAIEFAWHGFPQLGLWQKPGAELLCIEPWHGYSSPAGWDGEFPDKPGHMHLAPGESRTLGWSVRPLPA